MRLLRIQRNQEDQDQDDLISDQIEDILPDESGPVGGLDDVTERMEMSFRDEEGDEQPATGPTRKSERTRRRPARFDPDVWDLKHYPQVVDMSRNVNRICKIVDDLIQQY